MRSEEFDVDGLLNDLDHLWSSLASSRKRMPTDEYIRGAMNMVDKVAKAIKRNQNRKHWQQGTLFELFEKD